MTHGGAVGRVAVVLSPRVRAGLDVARALSALYVVAHHVSRTIEVPPAIGIAFSFGQEAVIVFFALSGFVIFANEQDRVRHARGYYLRRLRRIYPPVLFAMVVSTAMSLLGFVQLAPNWFEATITLLSLDDLSALKPGVIADPYLHNDPLWSLSYEVVFYAVFPLVMVLWRRSEILTRHTIGAVSVLAYATYLILPNHFSLVFAYLLIWWGGAMAARAHLLGGITVRKLAPELGWTTVLVVFATCALVVYPAIGLGNFPILMIRHFALGLLMLLVLCSPVRRLLARISLGVARPASWIAGVSFGIYLIHYPILVQTNAARSWWFFPAAALTLILAWVGDRGLARILPRAPTN
jgi:peptidoglycan/LPS O-acetylase OafA/YrhL